MEGGHTAASVSSRPRTSLSVFPSGLPRAVGARGRRWRTPACPRKRAFAFLIHASMVRGSAWLTSFSLAGRDSPAHQCSAPECTPA